MASFYGGQQWKEWVAPTPYQYVIQPSSNTWSTWATSNTTTLDIATSTMNYKTETVWGQWNDATQMYHFRYPEYTTSTNTITTWQKWNQIVKDDYVPKIREQLARDTYLAKLTEVNFTLQRIDREALQAARVKEEEERKAARARASVLLRENLTDAQKVMLDRHGYFHVRSQHGRIYRIYCNVSDHNNVYEVDKRGRELRQLCAQPRGGQPYEDSWLAQKLTLELAEDMFIEAAYKVDIRNAREQGEMCDLDPEPELELVGV